MNIDKPTLSKLIGQTLGPPQAAAPSAPTDPTSPAGEKSFDQLLKHVQSHKAGALNTATIAPSSTARPGESPADLLNRLATTDPTSERHKQIEKGAEGLVSNALILPMLKQLRRSSFNDNSIFSGGNGEKMFGPQFDMELADRIAKSPRLGVKNALIARLERKDAQTKPVAAENAKSNAPARIDLNA